MRAYEAGKPMYFATRKSSFAAHHLAKSRTAPIQLVYALHTSLTSILKQSPSLTERFTTHKAVSKHVKDTLADLGFGFVPLDRSIAANGMTAVRYPSGVSAADILPKLAE